MQVCCKCSHLPSASFSVRSPLEERITPAGIIPCSSRQEVPKKVRHASLFQFVNKPISYLPIQSSRKVVDRLPPIAPPKHHSEAWHGCIRTDPFRYLQDPANQVADAYWRSEESYANEQLARDSRLTRKIRNELRGYIPRTAPPDLPDVVGPWAYSTRWVDGHVVHVRKPVGGGSELEEVILDTRYLRDRTATFVKCQVSPDHAMLAYLTVTTGGEQGTLHIRSLDRAGTASNEEELTDVFNFVWGDAHRDLYYTRLDGSLRAANVYRHRIGAVQTIDNLIFHEPDSSCFLDVSVTKDRKYITINSNAAGTSEVRILRADRSAFDRYPRIVLPRALGSSYFVDHNENDLFIFHNHDAQSFRLSKLPSKSLEDGPATWTDLRDVLTTSNEGQIEEIDLFAHFALLHVRKRGLAGVVCADLESGERHVVNLPEQITTVQPDVNLAHETNLVRFKTSSPLTMQTAYVYDMEFRKLQVVYSRKPVGIEADMFVVERIHVIGRDGTEIPVTVMRLRSLVPDGKNPFNVRGYGAYGTTLDPHFRPDILPLLTRGFIVALAHVRGGGELGPTWHEAGSLYNKARSSSDCIDVAEHFVTEGWTNPAVMTAHGVSAGGLLMATTLNLRPNLFRAMVLRVPFLDPLSAMLDASSPLTVIEHREWGDPVTDSKAYDCIASYSPYDNLPARSSTSVLITASQEDQRVPMWHSLKWMARMRAQAAKEGGEGKEKRLLLRIVRDRAHTASGDESRLEDAASECSFFITEVGLE
ncbi:hypothetical protein HKX48_003014 [Thoreauomyces humboldtii]|nr:hypothetical protein HKX48_003014 [Thoreauomyces humboldtii]